MAAERSVRRKVLIAVLGSTGLLVLVALAFFGSSLRAIFGASTAALAGAAPAPRSVVEAHSKPLSFAAPPAAASAAPAEEEGKMGSKSPPQDDAARHAALLEEIKKHGVLKALGTDDNQQDLKDILGNGEIASGDIDSALSNAQGVGVASGSDGQGHAVRGTVSVDPPTDILGAEAAEIVKSVKTRTGGLRSCYEKELRLNPTLRGKVGVRFIVEATGHVGESAIENDSVHDDAMTDCMTRLMRSWVFAVKPEEPVAASFGFTFAPAEAGSGNERRVRMGAVGASPE
jgi:hypothetical protein